MTAEARAALVEKMARALHGASYPGTPVRYEKMTEESKRFYRNNATAALAAHDAHMAECGKQLRDKWAADYEQHAAATAQKGTGT